MSKGISETEMPDESSAGLDMMNVEDVVGTLIASQRSAADAVFEARAAICAVVVAIVERMERGGRLHYVGAGSSGRLAVLDAAEMPPTFGTAPGLVCAHIAGGGAALRTSVEGAEDDAEAGSREMREQVGADDVAIGISASGAAPYVLGAMSAARDAGAYTAAIVCNTASPLASAVDTAIVLRTGAESVAGSTRLKAGTAQKIALNTISTAVMVRCGRVYDNLMVDVVASNKKLRLRAMRLLQMLSGVDEAQAGELLDASHGSVKVAAVMAKHHVEAIAARALLERNGGRLRAALS